MFKIYLFEFFTSKILRIAYNFFLILTFRVPLKFDKLLPLLADRRFNFPKTVASIVY